MNDGFEHFGKRFDLVSVGTATMEGVEWVDQLAGNGRADVRKSFPERLGGIGFHATRGIRSFDTSARVAIAALIGDEDAEPVLEATGHLACDTNWLWRVPRKRTNRSHVICDETQRLILRRARDISFEHDFQPHHAQHLADLIAQSWSCLLGNLPLDLTQHLIEIARDTGTYVLLCPGSRQWKHLRELQPHGLMVNFEEAGQATDLERAAPAEIFAALVDVCPVDHVLVMTGSGVHPTWVRDVQGERDWQLDPVPLDMIPDRCRPANCLGTGDVMAGALSFLTGSADEPPVGEDLFECVRFAQEVALLHLTQSPAQRRRVQQSYARTRSRGVQLGVA
jgi:sugar/nucleoside kinase (ribokinase family)